MIAETTDKESVTLLGLIDLPESASAVLPDTFRLDRAKLGPDGNWILPQSAEVYRGIVTGYLGTVDAILLDRLPKLDLIACFTSGRDMVDQTAAAMRGITVISNNAALADSVADHALALLLGLARDIPGCDQYVRSGKWQHQRHAPGSLLAGKNLGIAGFGAIGQGIARRGAAFGMEIGAFSRRNSVNTGQKFFSNPGALADWADWLVLALPGGNATQHMIDAEVLRRLGPEGRIINVGRGTLIDEAALICALRNGTVAGAALDVFASEPDPNPALLSLPNLLVSPHQASNTVEAEHIRGTALASILSTHFYPNAKAPTESI